MADPRITSPKMASASYPGSKAVAGVWQRIVGAMPVHRVYVEPFLGRGAVLRRKRAADWSIGIDLDPAVVDAWQREPRPGPLVVCGDGIQTVERWGELLGDDVRSSTSIRRTCWKPAPASAGSTAAKCAVRASTSVCCGPRREPAAG